MSRSKPRNNLKNPAKKFISLSGKSGKFEYWDRDKEENIPLDYPVTFLVLDNLVTIKGYNDKADTGIYSNEIHNLESEELCVKYHSTGQVIGEGLYKSIKDKIKNYGAKFAQSIYAIIKNDDGEFEIVNFQLKGSANSAWIEFTKDINVMGNNAIVITGSEPMTKGNTKYFVPVFKSIDTKQETLDVAYEKDKELQKYLAKYKAEKDEERVGSRSDTEEEPHPWVEEVKADEQAFDEQPVEYKEPEEEADDIPF